MSEEKTDEDKENVEQRADTSMSDLTFAGSAREVNKNAVISEEGVLDLSDANLTNLDRHFQEEYANVRELNVSNNEIEVFAYMKLFPNCEVLDARNNQMKKFSADFNKNIKRLLLSGNHLANASQFARFENLIHLDLSQNEIEEQVTLPLRSLEVLNLSRNKLKSFPDLSKCTILRQIDLSENEISDLLNLEKKMAPIDLPQLSLAYNSFTDLTQFAKLSHFKTLKEVSIVGNPCIENLEQFDYRPYIFACCSALERLDDQDIELPEQTKGEYICIAREVRLLTPGNHERLCELMISYFPNDNDDGPPTPAQKACQKALEEIERSERSETTTVNSIYSPSGEWSEKMKGRTGETPKSNKKNIRMVSPTGSKRRSGLRNGADFTTPKRPEPLNFSSRTNSTETIVMSSSRTELSVNGITTPLPVIERLNEHRVRAPSVADVTTLPDTEEQLRKRVAELEAKVEALVTQNSHLTNANDQIVGLLEKFQEEQGKMWAAIASSIPKPENMTATFYSDDEQGLQTHVVRWELPLVQGYEIHVDGNHCGRVIGKNNSARITDLDPDKEHTVQIQAIGINGNHGEMSGELNITPRNH